jgi:saccharopine dehydrogenase-like NADP-dependent oxidoreductase
MYITVQGWKGQQPLKIESFMWEEADAEFSAMARVTAFPACIGAKLVASGRVSLRGIRAPEECVTGKEYNWFLDELKKKDICIQETISPA